MLNFQKDVAAFLADHPECQDGVRYMNVPGESEPQLMMNRDSTLAFAAWCVQHGRTTPEKATKLREMLQEAPASPANPADPFKFLQELETRMGVPLKHPDIMMYRTMVEMFLEEKPEYKKWVSTVPLDDDRPDIYQFAGPACDAFGQWLVDHKLLTAEQNEKIKQENPPTQTPVANKRPSLN